MELAHLIGPPIIGMEFDPFEAFDRLQRHAIQRAVHARARGDMGAYRAAMADVDRITDERAALHYERRDVSS